MRQRVAITGIGMVAPIGIGRESVWSALAEGVSGIAEITHFDASGFDVRLAGEVKNPIQLPDEVAKLAEHDSKVGFAFAACAEALSQAGVKVLDTAALLHMGTSLEIFELSKVIHNGKPDFVAVVRESLKAGSIPLQYPLDTAGQLIAKRFGTPGQVLTNCSACAAGAQAIGHGFSAVRSGRFKMAVCGGFDSMINPLGVGGFQLLGALTTRNDRGASACRPFDSERNGTVLGEGAAMVVMEPLEQAVAEGKDILAEVCGYGSTLDAHSLSAPDPDGDGAKRSMRAALKDAELSTRHIHHINVHGTGTLLNDEVEAKAIRDVFAAEWETIPVSATKSMTGHLIGAAGAMEVGASMTPFMRGVIPPNTSLDRVAQGCELNHVTQKGVTFSGEYVLTNSFGFGGQNATLVLRRGTL
jgi:3-oxoacyl-[acyl-carrier-protein] synthase II